MLLAPLVLALASIQSGVEAPGTQPTPDQLSEAIALVQAALEAKARATADLPELPCGCVRAGELRGRVVDDDGRPVGGVTVILHHDHRTGPVRLTSNAGDGSPPDLVNFQASAEYWLGLGDWSPRSEIRVESDAEGWYVLPVWEEAEQESWPPEGRSRFHGVQGSYVSGYKRGWTFTGARLEPGNSANLRGVRRLHLKVELRLPGGELPERGIVRVTSERGRQVQVFEWTPDATELFAEGDSVVVQAFVGDPLWILGVNDAMGAFESGELELERGEIPERVTLGLEPRGGVLGEVKVEGPLRGGWVVRAHRLVDGEPVVESAAWPDAPLVSLAGHRFHFEPDQPGMYRFELCRGVQPSSMAESEWKVLDRVEVEVGEVLRELILTRPAPDPDDYLVLRCEDAGGAPLRDCSVGLERVSDDPTYKPFSTRGLRYERGAIGELWIERASLPELRPGERLPLRITKGQNRKAIVEVEAEDRNRRVVLGDAPILTVAIVGFAERLDRGDLALRLISAHTGLPISGTHEPYSSWWPRAALSSEGTVGFRDVPVGPARVVLGRIRSEYDETFHVLAHTLVDVPPEGASIEIEVPPLHPLKVHAPGLPVGAEITLRRELDLGPNFHPGYNRLETGSDRRARFGEIAAGTYLVGARQQPMIEVEVPGSEVVYRPKRHARYRVVITEESERLYAAGFREGDVIQRVRGVDLAELPKPGDFLSYLSRIGARVTVLRGGVDVEFEFEPIGERRDGLWGGQLIEVHE